MGLKIDLDSLDRKNALGTCTFYMYIIKDLHFPFSNLLTFFNAVYLQTGNSLTYHTGTHAGLPTAQPGHGGGRCHLLGGKGTGAGLGDVGVRRAVIHIIRAIKRKQDAHSNPFKAVS